MLWFALALVVLFPSRISFSKGTVSIEIWWTRYTPFLKSTESVSQPKQEENV